MFFDLSIGIYIFLQKFSLDLMLEKFRSASSCNPGADFRHRIPIGSPKFSVWVNKPVVPKLMVKFNFWTFRMRKINKIADKLLLFSCWHRRHSQILKVQWSLGHAQGFACACLRSVSLATPLGHLAQRRPPFQFQQLKYNNYSGSWQ